MDEDNAVRYAAHRLETDHRTLQGLMEEFLASTPEERDAARDRVKRLLSLMSVRVSAVRQVFGYSLADELDARHTDRLP